jgi:membrane protease YdiL (CAAX protease family)
LTTVWPAVKKLRGRESSRGEMAQAVNSHPVDNFNAFFSFDPGSQKAMNWAYAFFFWLFLAGAGGGCYNTLKPYTKSYPPVTWPNALLIHTPLISNAVFLVAIILFATGLRTLNINRALRWGGGQLALRLRGRELRLSLVTWATLYAFAGFLLYLLQQYLSSHIGGPATRFDEEFSDAPLKLKAFALTAVFCAPLVEELLFRGVLFIQAYGTVRKLAATTISTALFALVHVEQYSSPAGEINWGAMSSIIALGLLCCLCRSVTGRVWPAFVVHTVYNLSITVVFFNSLTG